MCLKGVTIALGAVGTGMNEKEFISLESHNTVEASRQPGLWVPGKLFPFSTFHHSTTQPKGPAATFSKRSLEETAHARLPPQATLIGA